MSGSDRQSREKAQAGIQGGKALLHAAVLGAMDCEVERIRGRLTDAKTAVIGPWKLITGGLGGGLSVTLVRCGIGTANAAACAALTLQTARPDLLIIQGTAGAHSPDLRRGDIVLGERLVNIGAYMSEAAGPGAGADTSRWKPFETELMTADIREDVFELRSSEELMRAAEETAELLRAEGRLSVKVLRGTAGSGDVWNRERDRIAELREQRGTDCEDMESYSAAQICASFGVPFLSVRVISNSELTGEDYDPGTAFACQDFVMELLEHLAHKGSFGGGKDMR